LVPNNALIAGIALIANIALVAGIALIADIALVANIDLVVCLVVCYQGKLIAAEQPRENHNLVDILPIGNFSHGVVI